MTRTYDLEAKDHPDRQYNYAFDYLMHRFMLRTFAPFQKTGTALELGCFHGNFTKLLCEQFDDVEVVEASAECIGIATAACGGKARFNLSTFENFTPTRQFDNIFLVHTLEHLDDPVAVLRQISGWLAPGGRLFVATPNAHAGSRQIAVLMGLISHNAAVTPAEEAHGHRVTYSLDTLGADVRAAGLAPLTHGGIFFKGLANFQLDAARAADIISAEYMEGCYQLGRSYPDLCSSIFLLCERGRPT